MADPVNLADVLEGAEADYPDLYEDDPRSPWDFATDAILAYGGGDPVVVMPDGTLRRGEPISHMIRNTDHPNVIGVGGIPASGSPWVPVEAVIITDPVVPE